MFKNIKFTIRNLHRSGVYSFINVVGLAVSLAACAFIVMWVQDERSYDRFHKDAENIYLTVTHFRSEGANMDAPVSPGLFAPTAKDDFTTVEDYCRLAQWGSGYIKYQNIKSSSITCYYADPNFFNFFNFPIVKGNSSNPLQNSNDVVINERLAKELFGLDEPVGKTVSLDNGTPVHISAVMKDMPHNTNVQNVDLVGKFAIDSASINASYYHSLLTTWNDCEFYSFMRLQKGTDAVFLAEKVTEKQTDLSDIRTFTLQPIVDLHLYNLRGEPDGIKTVRLFQLIALAILIIACINYVNLLTARASKRHREIGVKKIIGARKMALFIELIGEAVILFAFAMVIAVILNFSMLDTYNILSGKELKIRLFDGNIWLTYTAMLFVVVVLAGLYPAYMLASYKTSNMLQSVTTKIGNKYFRKILVVTQFTASTVLIVGTIVLSGQMKYIREKDMGYKREQVLICNTFNMSDHFNTIKNELERQASIQGVTSSSENIMSVVAFSKTASWEGKTTDGMMMYKRERADTSFLRVMGLTLVEGDGFTSVHEKQYVINEAAVKAFGMNDPVGKWIEEPGSKIVGVVKDFHFASLHNKIEPIVIQYEPNFFWQLYVRTTAGRTKEAIAALEIIWKQYNPDYTFNYAFLDDTFDRIYKSDMRTGQLFSAFAIIAILISCLGLFGLVVFTAELKTKEIGIRKALGASMLDIVKLLINEFLILVGIAILIAFPLAYYWLENMLQDYAYRISISMWMFVAAALITLALTLLTVGRMAIKAATKNPLDAIKSE